MIYESHLRAAEAAGWTLDSVPWNEIDRASAAGERQLHQALHDAALIEGYLPLYGARMMQLLWDDVDATAVLSLELYEGLKHYTALRRYLERVGFELPPDGDPRLVEARARARERVYAPDDLTRHLTNFMCSELFAAYFFRRIGERTKEPVLARLLALLTRDELRHAAGAGDVLRQRIERDRARVDDILAAASEFRHYGSDVVTVPVAEQHDFEAMMAVNRKVRQVCGIAPVEHLKEGIDRANL